jgi:hypothetical protein
MSKILEVYFNISLYISFASLRLWVQIFFHLCIQKIIELKSPGKFTCQGFSFNDNQPCLSYSRLGCR